MAKVTKTETEWRQELSDVEYQITRKKGTEPAFTGRYWNTKDGGVYRCRCCGTGLFDSKAKFDSGTGWPSFTAPSTADAVDTEADRSLFIARTEAVCARCDAHLGHVFDDGPAPTGKRYCINSAALSFDKE